MQVAVACGGTGGHIFPGLATARELAGRGHQVTLWMAGKDVESEAVKGWPGDIVTVPARGLPSGVSLTSITNGLKLLAAIGKVRGLMKSRRPDVLLAMGSYASVGPVGAAIQLGIPYVLHEANVVPGRALKLFSRRAAAVATCFEETRFYLRKRKLVLTGMPLRRELMEVKRAPRAVDEPLRVLVMGGSRGAHALNERAPAALAALRAKGEHFNVTHLTGEQDYTAVAEAYRLAGLSAEVMPFTRDIGAIYAASDFALCRAGAATCAELLYFGMPSLLVPYPHAIHDHQTHNARAMEKAGAADMVPEADITHDWLCSYLLQMLKREEARERMSKAARARAGADGAAALANLVENVARNHETA
jgi:UDP-N-acetylglucosamine--N-acetylmuramyl-(pentapeptide) pyrophosphoryl-undecaprenol N-acetylglucosamine transferase